MKGRGRTEVWPLRQACLAGLGLEGGLAGDRRICFARASDTNIVILDNKMQI
jgi:hypothetical protein